VPLSRFDNTAGCLPTRPRFFTIDGDAAGSPATFFNPVFYEQCAEGGYVAFDPARPGCQTQAERLTKSLMNDLRGKPKGSMALRIISIP
jgi:hypothetical protein